MSEVKRNTKKSRLVSEFSECIIDMVLNDHTAPSKSQIVDCVVASSLSEGVASAIKTMLEDELANELERYFSDAVRAAATELDMPFHLVSKRFYTKKCTATTKEVARTHIATFGNGRNNKAAGVRFIETGDGNANDMYLMIAAEKRVNTTQSVVKSTVKYVENGIEKGVLPALTLGSLPETKKIAAT